MQTWNVKYLFYAICDWLDYMFWFEDHWSALICKQFGILCGPHDCFKFPRSIDNLEHRLNFEHFGCLLSLAIRQLQRYMIWVSQGRYYLLHWDTDLPIQPRIMMLWIAAAKVVDLIKTFYKQSVSFCRLFSLQINKDNHIHCCIDHINWPVYSWEDSVIYMEASRALIQYKDIILPV